MASMELTSISSAAKDDLPYGAVLFTNQFAVIDFVGHKQTQNISVIPRRAGKRFAYLRFAKVGQKILWLEYSTVLQANLSSWPYGIFVAENDEGKYLLLLLPSECERRSVWSSTQKRWILGGIYAPEDVIEDLRKRIGKLPDNAFFVSKDAEVVNQGGRKTVQVKPYFQIFDELLMMKAIAK